MGYKKIASDLFQMSCLITLIILIFSFSIQPVTAQSTITVVPSDPNVAAGEDFSVDIKIETDQTFVGAQMRIIFDNSLISATKLEEGDLFSNSGLFYMFNTGTMDNSHGSIDNIFAVTLGAGGISNDGDFIHIDMIAGDRSGICNIQLENVIVSNSEGVAIPVTLRNANIEITATQTDNTGSDASTGSGGGGGGTGNTGEDAENIEFVETKNVYVMSNNQTSYVFENEANPIKAIKYLSLKNAGTISGTIEILNGRSAMVAKDPSGLVYKNMNIWLGKAGYATKSNIDSPVIVFKVSREWIDKNDVSEGSIVLMRYNSDKWNSLPTEKVGEDETCIFFESETPGFSPFSIVSRKPEIIGTLDKIIMEEASPETENSPVQSKQESNKQDPDINIHEKEDADKVLSQNSMFLSCLALLFLAYRKK